MFKYNNGLLYLNWIVLLLPFIVVGQLRSINWIENKAFAFSDRQSLRFFESSEVLEWESGIVEKFKGFYLRITPSDSCIQIQTHYSELPLPYNQFDFNKLFNRFFVNGGYFGINSTYSLVIDNYKVHSLNAQILNRNDRKYLVSRPAFYINKDGEPNISWVYSNSKNETIILNKPLECDLQNSTSSECLSFANIKGSEMMRLAIGGGPMLIKDGFVINEYGPEHFLEDVISSKAPRTAIGITKSNEVIIIVVDGRQEHSVGITLNTLAHILLDLGCVNAMNLDGGSSSFMAFGGNLINNPSRNIPPKVTSLISVGLN